MNRLKEFLRSLLMSSESTNQPPEDSTDVSKGNAPSKSAKFREGLTSWLKIIGLAATTVSGIWAVIYPISEYFHAKRVEKEVTWTNEMIVYLDALNDAETEAKKNQAIFLLSAYEMESVPFLLLELENTKNEEVIYNALKIIRNKKRVDDDKFLRHVADYAKDFFLTEYVKKKSMNKDGMVNFIRVLGKLGRENPSIVRQLLGELKSRSNQMTAINKTDIEFEVDAALKLIQDDF